MSSDMASQFDSLVESACEAYRERPDPVTWEPPFLNVLNFIKTHPAQKSFFIGQFIELVENPRSELIPLIEFCMFELRWEEVANAARHRIDAVDRSLTKKWMANIVESLTDDWDGTLYYDYYSSS